jgi:hypothetical protein
MALAFFALKERQPRDFSDAYEFFGIFGDYGLIKNTSPSEESGFGKFGLMRGPRSDQRSLSSVLEQILRLFLLGL